MEMERAGGETNLLLMCKFSAFNGENLKESLNTT
jgi:hypothetical protein